MEKYYIWICRNCGKQLSEEIMGKKCPHCTQWTYNVDCKKEVKSTIKAALNTAY